MIDATTLRRLWPRAPQALIDAVVKNSAAVFQKYHIDNPLRQAHFMAQISHESDGGTITEENLNYTTPQRLMQVWPSRFKSIGDAEPYVHNPKKLGSMVYNGRLGNKDGTSDGYDYRGRGLLQLTGRENYRAVGLLTGLPLEATPSLVNLPSNALTVAAAEFERLNCLPACDADDIRTVTKRVNGGYIGIDSRRAWLTKWKLAIPTLPGKLPETEEETKELDNTHLPREADGDPVKATPSDKMTEKITIATAAASPLVGALADWKVAAVICAAVIIGLVAFFILKRKGVFE